LALSDADWLAILAQPGKMQAAESMLLILPTKVFAEALWAFCRDVVAAQ
jgi:hypothetical protein